MWFNPIYEIWRNQKKHVWHARNTKGSALPHALKLTWFKEFFGVAYSAARNTKTYKLKRDKMIKLSASESCKTVRYKPHLEIMCNWNNRVSHGILDRQPTT